MTPVVKPIERLTDIDRREMFGLLERCFSGVALDVFEDDLANKTLAILLRAAHGELQGFSTLALYHAAGPGGEVATIACSGDTIVAPEAWGSSALSRAWINTAMRWHAEHGSGRLYWLLITSGFRTYRFLPVFFRCFYPHYEYQTSPESVSWTHRLAEERWGAAYDRASGIVRFEQPQRLRLPLAGVPAGKADDPHIRHFLKLNPGHTKGDELVCLCELSGGNLTRAGRRMVDAGNEQSQPHVMEIAR